MITPVILSGGAGSRLWPLSRPEKPKQLLALLGDRTMLQMTAARTGNADLFKRPMIVGNALHAEQIERQLRDQGVALGSLILEPVPRNTAPAITLAALLALPGDLLLVMPSDHLIRDTEAFLEAVSLGMPAAVAGNMVTFGIKPDRPDTGFGYIRAGSSVSEKVSEVDAFVEKPDAATAQELVKSGNHFWNGGIFLFERQAFLAAMREHAPDVLDACERSLASGTQEGAYVLPGADAFGAAPSISIDYALMERLDTAVVVPVEMGWSDVGTWDALCDVQAGSCGIGSAPVVSVEAERCFTLSDGPTVALVGVSDLIVIATGDAVLITSRGQSQRVKEAVEKLEATKRIVEDAP